MENDLETRLENSRVVRRKEGDPRFITVLLGNDNIRELKKFHCVNCGYTVFHYYSETRIIVEGEVRDITTRPIDVVCGRQGCKTVYRIA